MRKENAKFDTKFISEAGSYLVNADYFAFVELKDYACYVMADGIDSDERKESAKLAVTTVITEFSETPGMSKGKLKRFLKAAHNALLQEADEIRLEASIVIVLTDYKKMIWGHAGNARLLWIKNGAIKMSTKDTSLTQRMVDQEEIALDQLSMHEERNNLYTYLGQPGRMTPVISKKKKLEDGDIVLLITRGVWESVGDAEIIDAVDGVSKAEDVCTGLEDVILSQRREIIENYSIASIFINKIYQNPKAGKYKRIFKIVFGIVMAIAILLLTLSIASCSSTKRKLEGIEDNKKAGIEFLGDQRFDMANTQFTSAADAAKKLRVRKKSKNAQKVQIVELYQKMMMNIKEGVEALDEENYNTASHKFKDANKISDELTRDYEEDNSQYAKMLKAYEKYSQNMNSGEVNLKNKKYEDAVDHFTKASKAIENIDTKKSDIANVAGINVGIQECVDAGSGYEAEAKTSYDEKDFEKALLNYESAKDAFTQAQEKGYSAADGKITLLETHIANTRAAIANRTDQEKMDRANKLEKEGNNAKDKNEAKEKYNQAVDLLQSLTGADNKLATANQLASLKQKTEGTDPMPELLNALDCLSRGQYADAIAALEKLKTIFSENNDSDKEVLMNTYITAAKETMNKQANTTP